MTMERQNLETHVFLRSLATDRLEIPTLPPLPCPFFLNLLEVETIIKENERRQAALKLLNTPFSPSLEKHCNVDRELPKKKLNKKAVQSSSSEGSSKEMKNELNHKLVMSSVHRSNVNPRKDKKTKRRSAQVASDCTGRKEKQMRKNGDFKAVTKSFCLHENEQDLEESTPSLLKPLFEKPNCGIKTGQYISEVNITTSTQVTNAQLSGVGFQEHTVALDNPHLIKQSELEKSNQNENILPLPIVHRPFFAPGSLDVDRLISQLMDGCQNKLNESSSRLNVPSNPSALADKTCVQNSQRKINLNSSEFHNIQSTKIFKRTLKKLKPKAVVITLPKRDLKTRKELVNADPEVQENFSSEATRLSSNLNKAETNTTESVDSCKLVSEETAISKVLKLSDPISKTESHNQKRCHHLNSLVNQFRNSRESAITVTKVDKTRCKPVTDASERLLDDYNLVKDHDKSVTSDELAYDVIQMKKNSISATELVSASSSIDKLKNIKTDNLKEFAGSGAQDSLRSKTAFLVSGTKLSVISIEEEPSHSVKNSHPNVVDKLSVATLESTQEAGSHDKTTYFTGNLEEIVGNKSKLEKSTFRKIAGVSERLEGEKPKPVENNEPGVAYTDSPCAKESLASEPFGLSISKGENIRRNTRKLLKFGYRSMFPSTKISVQSSNLDGMELSGNTVAVKRNDPDRLLLSPMPATSESDDESLDWETAVQNDISLSVNKLLENTLNEVNLDNASPVDSCNKQSDSNVEGSVGNINASTANSIEDGDHAYSMLNDFPVDMENGSGLKILSVRGGNGEVIALSEESPQTREEMKTKVIIIHRGVKEEPSDCNFPNPKIATQETAISVEKHSKSNEKIVGIDCKVSCHKEEKLPLFGIEQVNANVGVNADNISSINNDGCTKLSQLPLEDSAVNVVAGGNLIDDADKQVRNVEKITPELLFTATIDNDSSNDIGHAGNLHTVDSENILEPTGVKLSDVTLNSSSVTATIDNDSSNNLGHTVNLHTVDSEYILEPTVPKISDVTLNNNSVKSESCPTSENYPMELKQEVVNYSLLVSEEGDIKVDICENYGNMPEGEKAHTNVAAAFECSDLDDFLDDFLFEKGDIETFPNKRATKQERTSPRKISPVKNPLTDKMPKDMPVVKELISIEGRPKPTNRLRLKPEDRLIANKRPPYLPPLRSGVWEMPDCHYIWSEGQPLMLVGSSPSLRNKNTFVYSSAQVQDTKEDVKGDVKKIGIVLYPGHSHPLPSVIAFHLKKLRQSTTDIDSNWANFSASAVVQPSPRRDRYILPVFCPISSKCEPEISTVSAYESSSDISGDIRESMLELVNKVVEKNLAAMTMDCSVVLKRIKLPKMAPMCLEHQKYFCFLCGIGQCASPPSRPLIQKVPKEFLLCPETYLRSPEHFDQIIQVLKAGKNMNDVTLKFSDLSKESVGIGIMSRKKLLKLFNTKKIYVWSCGNKIIISTKYMRFPAEKVLGLQELLKTIDRMSQDMPDYIILYKRSMCWQLCGSLKSPIRKLNHPKITKNYKGWYSTLENPTDYSFAVKCCFVPRWFVVSQYQLYDRIVFSHKGADWVINRKDLPTTTTYVRLPNPSENITWKFGLHISPKLHPYMLFGPYPPNTKHSLTFFRGDISVPIHSIKLNVIPTNVKLHGDTRVRKWIHSTLTLAWEEGLISEVWLTVLPNSMKLRVLKLAASREREPKQSSTSLGSARTGNKHLMERELQLSSTSLQNPFPGNKRSKDIEVQSSSTSLGNTLAGKKRLKSSQRAYVLSNIKELGYFKVFKCHSRRPFVNFPTNPPERIYNFESLTLKVRQYMVFIPKELEIKWGVYIWPPLNNLRPFSRTWLTGSWALCMNGPKPIPNSGLRIKNFEEWKVQFLAHRSTVHHCRALKESLGTEATRLSDIVNESVNEIIALQASARAFIKEKSNLQRVVKEKFEILDILVKQSGLPKNYNEVIKSVIRAKSIKPLKKERPPSTKFQCDQPVEISRESRFTSQKRKYSEYPSETTSSQCKLTKTTHPQKRKSLLKSTDSTTIISEKLMKTSEKSRKTVQATNQFLRVPSGNWKIVDGIAIEGARRGAFKKTVRTIPTLCRLTGRERIPTENEEHMEMHEAINKNTYRDVRQIFLSTPEKTSNEPVPKISPKSLPLVRAEHDYHAVKGSPTSSPGQVASSWPDDVPFHVMLEDCPDISNVVLEYQSGPDYENSGRETRQNSNNQIIDNDSAKVCEVYAAGKHSLKSTQQLHRRKDPPSCDAVVSDGTKYSIHSRKQSDNSMLKGFSSSKSDSSVANLKNIVDHDSSKVHEVYAVGKHSLKSTEQLHRRKDPPSCDAVDPDSTKYSIHSRKQSDNSLLKGFSSTKSDSSVANLKNIVDHDSSKVHEVYAVGKHSLKSTEQLHRRKDPPPLDAVVTDAIKYANNSRKQTDHSLLKELSASQSDYSVPNLKSCNNQIVDHDSIKMRKAYAIAEQYLKSTQQLHHKQDTLPYDAVVTDAIKHANNSRKQTDHSMLKELSPSKSDYSVANPQKHVVIQKKPGNNGLMVTLSSSNSKETLSMPVIIPKRPADVLIKDILNTSSPPKRPASDGLINEILNTSSPSKIAQSTELKKLLSRGVTAKLTSNCAPSLLKPVHAQSTEESSDVNKELTYSKKTILSKPASIQVRSESFLKQVPDKLHAIDRAEASCQPIWYQKPMAELLEEENVGGVKSLVDRPEKDLQPGSSNDTENVTKRESQSEGKIRRRVKYTPRRCDLAAPPTTK